MPDWKKSMQQTFEYYEVDPGTWKDKRLINNVKSCSISWDSEVETLGSASFEVTDNIGECYIRVYLITIQNGVTEKHPLGTFLVQTPSTSFDGKVQAISLDAYTPLIELKEKQPPIGFTVLKEDENKEPTNVLDAVYKNTRENLRAPVIKPEGNKKLEYDFVANTDDTWISYNTDLLKAIECEYSLDELGRVSFSPKQDAEALQPVCTFDDGNSSILYPDITINKDLYGIPNVVEVIYTSAKANVHVRAVNDDPSSPISTVSRGREIPYRITDPSVAVIQSPDAAEIQLQEYANQTLRDLSNLECSVSFSHGYYPVHVGDCVRLNYERAGLVGVKARIISQSIKCKSGMQVSTKAVFKNKLWG